MLEINPKEIPIPKLHQYLLGSVGPRPIAFVSTVDQEGNRNLSPFSSFNVFSANPPIAIFSPARNGRTNQTKDTLNNVKVVRECVINIVTYDMVNQMSLSSSPYESNIDEFVKAGFSAIDSKIVSPSRVKESPVQLECKVNEIVELGNQGGAGNLVICEIQMIHINEEVLDENQFIDQKKIDLVARMGGNWYCRADNNSMFEVEKPLATCGIGVDSIPVHIRNSDILTGNNLGQLGNITALPTETEVNEYKLIELSDLFQEFETNMSELEIQLHKKAQSLLAANKVNDAWKTLLAFND